MNHAHSVHCMHIHGWDMPLWCRPCRRSFEEFEGVEGQPTPGEPTPENRAAWMQLFERYVDTSLAYTVLAELERGDLPVPPSFDAPERTRPLSEILAPSAN